MTHYHPNPNTVSTSKTNRAVLHVGPKPKNPRDPKTWTPKQVVMAASWAKHEIQARTDVWCEPYDWVPGWTGNLTTDEIHQLAMQQIRSCAKQYRCQNCDKKHTTLAVHFPDIPALLQRIRPGDEVPAGECPDCGGLVHIVR